MSNTQDAFLLPPPAPQQAYQVKPSYKQADKAGKEFDAAGNDDGHNALMSFIALLNKAVDDTDESQPPQVLDLRFSAEHDQELKEYNAIFPLGEGRQLFSQAVWDLMASLKNGLEERGIDVSALPEEMNDALEMGLDAPAWDPKTVEAVLSKLRGKYAAVLESESENSRNIDIKVSVSDYLKFGLKASLTDNLLDVSEEEDLSEETALINSAPGAPQTSLPADGQAGVPQPLEQPWAVSRFRNYLKPDAQTETDPAAAREALLSDKQTGKNFSADAETLLNSEAKPRDEFQAGFRNAPGEREEQGEKGNTKRKDVPGPREAANSDKADMLDKLDKDADDPKTRTNFTEQRTAFDQFFEQVMTRRGVQGSASAPALELGKGFSLSQGETLRDGLDNVVHFVRANGGQKANLIIDPPALGRISVELTSGAAGLEASIKVSSEQVRQLIQDHLAQLKLSLEQQGVQLTHFSVDVQQDDAHRNQEQWNMHRRRGSRGANEEDAAGEANEEELFRVDLNQGLLYWIA
ncbi:MAG: flagellar hook-length control protein FliK [Synergistaceae bacterium]|nr:flagellar hook-length control protein FliK [Synergistaceae bacterium]